MRHILFINHLEALQIKKDSSLMIGLTLKELGKEVYLLFEEDFYFKNSAQAEFKVFEFEGSFKKNSFYLESFKKTKEKKIVLNSSDILHMRIDPPFDKRYLSYCWMLISQQKFGVKIVNDPKGIIIHNEKLCAYQTENAMPSYVGKNSQAFLEFVKEIKQKGHKDIILKPLELYQGIGVEKIPIDQTDLIEKFNQKIKEYLGPVVAQPFGEQVIKGEIRSLFFKGLELGSILKIPPKGHFLANIAQGASYHLIELSSKQKLECQKICNELKPSGIDFIAFDILGDSIQEVNLTCPGLLVEVSEAKGQNLAKLILMAII
jgi:glutathione synthase